MNPLTSLLRSTPGNPVGRRSLRPASRLLSLEQRFMFDAAAAVDAAHAAQAHDTPPPLPPAVTVREARPAEDQGKKEVVLVDTSLANYKTLEAGVRNGIGIVEFDGSKDGLAQIAQWAATQSNYDAIHILSHGAQGVVDLGTTHLSESLLSSTGAQQELAQLGRALTTDGDLLLYGCDVAAGSRGSELLDGLARATGADVAASTDATGAAARGGDWTLEARVGKIDTRELQISDYQDLLTQVTITDSDADYSTYQFTKSVDGHTFTFSGDPAYNSIGMDPTFGVEGVYSYDSTTASGVKLTITIDAGYTFDLNALDVALISGNLTIEYTDAGNNIHTLGKNSIGTGSWQTLSSSDLSAINDVVKIVISSDDYGLFQNFNFTDIKSIVPTTIVNGASLSSDTGSSGSDFITNTAGQTITGSLSAALGSGEKVEVSYDNGNSWSDATSYTVGSGSWSTTVTLSGSNTFEARVTNSNGSSTAYTHSYALDATAPTIVLSNLQLLTDTGVSNTDFITNTASQIITASLSGTLSAGDVVKGSVDGGTTWTDITSKVSGTTLSWNGATLSGSNILMLKVSDSAGNDGPTSSHTYTLDTTAPTNTVASVHFSNDTGTSATDFITRTASQTVSGTLSSNLLSGETVYVSLNGGNTWTAATATVGQSTWSLAGVTLTSSSTVRVKVSDTAGNDGSVLAQAYIYDTTAPTITVSGIGFSADSGAAGDFITNTASQTISATLSASLAAGDILYGSLDGGATWTDISNQVSNKALSWTGVTLSGSNILQLKVVDAAGNQGTVKNQAYILDASMPAAPSAPVLDSASDTGTSVSDKLTNDSTPTFTGTAESGSTVKIYDGVTLLGSVTAISGVWSYTTTTLSDGNHTITATATDAAGNDSAASGGLTIRVDSIPPAITSTAVPADGTYYSGDPITFSVSFDEAITVDTSGGTPRIAIMIGSNTRYATYVSGSGTSALLFSYTVASGDADSGGITIGTLSANGGSLRDAAGNDASLTLNGVGSTANVVVDGSQASVTGISSSTSDGSYGSGSTITITVDFSRAVDVDTSGGVPTLALSSGGTATYAGGDGTSTLSFTYTIGAGENSADLDYASINALVSNGAVITDAINGHNASLVLASPGSAGSLGANKDIVIDTVAPAATGDTVSFSADTGSSATDLITNTAAQTVSGSLTASLASGESIEVSLDNGATWSIATGAVGSKNWALAGQTLTGSDTLKVRVVDAAGNAGSAAAFAYVLDTAAPATVFSDIAFSNDTGVSGSDLITNTASQTISATLSSAPGPGDTVFGSLDNGATWTDITSKVSGASLIWNGVTLAGSDTLQLRVTDAAGNVGSATSRAYVLDTTAPTTSVASVAFSNDSGSSASDFLTRVAAQTVSGSLSAALAAGEIVYVSLDNGASWSAATASAGQSTWSLAGQTLTASNTLLVKVSNTAGNDGPVYAQAYVYDTAAPAAPTVDALATDSQAPVLTGAATLSAGESMTVTVGGAIYNVTPVAGAWSLDLSTAVPASGALTLALNQRYDVVAAVTDAAGNVARDASAGELAVAIGEQNSGTPPPSQILTPPPLPVQTQTPPPLAVAVSDGKTAEPSQATPALPPLQSEAAAGSWTSSIDPRIAAPDSADMPSPWQVSAVRGDLIGNDGVLFSNVPVPDLAAPVGGRIAFQLQADAFSFTGSLSDLSLSASQSNGQPLPGWLRFDARLGRFEGTPPPGFEGVLTFTITARDAQGHVAAQVFKIVVGKEKAQAVPAGRAGLDQQFRQLRMAGGIDSTAGLSRITAPSRPHA